MANNQIDLASLFSIVTQNLNKKKDNFNKADDHNHNHGDNMVEIFKVITQAMEAKQGKGPADQLEYAAQILRDKESGSAQVYALGLAQAAKDFADKQVTKDNVLQLVQSLLSGGEAAPAESGGSPLGSLVASFLGDQGASPDDEGLDAGDLLNAGLAFMAAKERGDSNVDALVDAVISSSAMGGSEHRAQSSRLVLSTIMDLVSSGARK
jgi:hypothetical protein